MSRGALHRVACGVLTDSALLGQGGGEGEEGVHQLGRQLLRGRAHLLAGDGFAVVNALLLREATQVLAGLGRSTLARGHVVTGSVLTGEAADLGVVHGVNVPEVSSLGHGAEGLALLKHRGRGEQGGAGRSTTGTLARGQVSGPVGTDGLACPRLACLEFVGEGLQLPVRIRDAVAVPRFPDRENVGHVVVGLGRALSAGDLAGDGEQGFTERGTSRLGCTLVAVTVLPSLALAGALKQVSHAQVRRLALGGLERGLDGLKARLREQAHVRLSSALQAVERVKQHLAGVRDGFVAPFRLVAREGDVAGQGGGSARLAQERSHVREHGGHLHGTARVERTGSGGGGQGAGLADDVVFRHRP